MLLPTTGWGQLVCPSFPCHQVPHHTLHTMVAYSQLLWQRTVVTSPHNTFISPLLLLLSCLPLLQPHAFLFNYPHVQILPKQSQQRFPWQLMLAAPCSPLNLSHHGEV